MKSMRIRCAACGEDTLVKRVPKYDGFARTGETFVCIACGHEYASESDVPFRDSGKPGIFSADDMPAKPEIFKAEDGRRNCRHCAHYAVNPFTQRCGKYGREVQATDFCADFEDKETLGEAERGKLKAESRKRE